MSHTLVNHIDASNDPAFEEIYALYERCFPLEEERVPKEDFEHILDSNHGEAFAARSKKLGTEAKYLVSYMKDPETGKIIGAAAYDVFKGCCDPSYGGTLHLSFVFVDPDERGKKYEKQLVESIKAEAQAFCGSDKPVLLIGESNAPGRMTVEQYQADAELSGADPAVRRLLMERSGGKTLHFPYTQPTLTVGGKACEYLDLLVQTHDDAVPAEVIREHLTRFFTDLFPPGTSMDMPGLDAMNAALQPGTMIPVRQVGQEYWKIKGELQHLVHNAAPHQIIQDVASDSLKARLEALGTRRPLTPNIQQAMAL